MLNKNGLEVIGIVANLQNILRIYKGEDLIWEAQYFAGEEIASTTSANTNETDD